MAADPDGRSARVQPHRHESNRQEPEVDRGVPPTGRALLGIYFPMSDGAQPSIVGQTTIPDIVTLFANRIARVPDSAANG